MKLIILSGCSGSGKSTYAKDLLRSDNYERGTLPSWARPRIIICSADDFFETPSGYKFDVSKLGEAHAQCLKRTIEAMIDMTPIIAVDNTNTTVLEMAPYYACAQAYGYEVELVTFQFNSGDAYMRNMHGVSLGTIIAQNKRIKGIEIPPHWKITRWEISAEYR